jgi:hypothetical protein
VGLYLIPVVWLGLSFFLVELVRQNSYAALLQWYAARWPNAFDPGMIGEVCFTPAHYRWLNAHSGWLMAGIGVALIGYIAFSRRILAVLRDSLALGGRVLVRMGEAFGRCSRREQLLVGLLFGAILAYRLYWVLAAPVQTDELCSYLYFARQGWWVTATCYPLPNNHILFNLISGVLDVVPGLTPRLVMRLPSLATDMLLQAIIFWLFLRWGGYWRAIVMVTGTAFCYLLSYYATHGRGYGMQELCAVVAGVAAWRSWVAEKRGGYSALFISFSVAGIYINPAFFYPFTATVLMVGYFLWRKRDRKGGIELGRAVLLTMGLTFLLYLPMLLVSGAGGLHEEIRNGAGVGFGWLIRRLPDLAYDFKLMSYYGRPGFWMLCGLALLAGWLYIRGRLQGVFYDVFIAYFIATAVSLLFWSILSRHYVYGRTLGYLALGVNLFFINSCYDLWRRKWILGCLLAVKLAGSLRGLYWERYSLDSLPEAGYSRVMERDLDRLWARHPSCWQITKSNDYYPMYLRLYLIERRDTAKVVYERNKAVGEVIFLPVIYRGNFDRSGYNTWGENRITAEGDSGMEIDVAK